MIDVERPEDLDDVMDNPEWSPADIRAGERLADYAPELSVNISRALSPHKPFMQEAGRPASKSVKAFKKARDER